MMTVTKTVRGVWGRAMCMKMLLSRRETVIMELVSQGLSNADIANSLGIGENTVKTHLKRIYAKLGACNRAHAAAIWVDARYR